MTNDMQVITEPTQSLFAPAYTYLERQSQIVAEVLVFWGAAENRICSIQRTMPFLRIPDTFTLISIPEWRIEIRFSDDVDMNPVIRHFKLKDRNILYAKLLRHIHVHGFVGFPEYMNQELNLLSDDPDAV